GAVERAHEHDVYDGAPRAGREFFGTGDEISGGVVDEDVERARVPDEVDHGFDFFEYAHIASQAFDRAFGRKFDGGLLEDFFAASADVDGCAEFEESLGHAFTEAGASAGDEDALGFEKVWGEHGFDVYSTKE